MSNAEYGPTVIPSVVDTENDAKNVNVDAKELIAKCISQCNQADISCRQLLSSFQLQNSISSTIIFHLCLCFLKQEMIKLVKV
jgi:hypothetical protein